MSSKDNNHQRSKNPLQILQNSQGSIILLRLKDGTEYKGLLKEIDLYMNCILEDATEIMDGSPIAKYNEIFIRGNNLLFIKPDASQLT
ncbi:MAG: LSM domain-containing protein [Promethearchaeota archaeon]|jgi:small nuclear ribonucleoprotein (snRNP)-like protein